MDDILEDKEDWEGTFDDCKIGYVLLECVANAGVGVKE